MSKITKVVRWDNRDTFALVYVEVGQEEAVVIVGGGVELYHSDKYDMTQAFVKKGVGARGEALPTPGNLTQLDDLLCDLVFEMGEYQEPYKVVNVQKAVAAIKSLMLDVVGEDELIPNFYANNSIAARVIREQNILRAEQRARIEQL